MFAQQETLVWQIFMRMQTDLHLTGKNLLLGGVLVTVKMARGHKPKCIEFYGLVHTFLPINIILVMMQLKCALALCSVWPSRTSAHTTRSGASDMNCLIAGINASRDIGCFAIRSILITAQKHTQ